MSTDSQKPEDPTEGKAEPAGEKPSSDSAATVVANTEQVEIERLKKDLLYLRADFENYRKRMLREQEQTIKFANEKMVKELISVLHVFDMALASASPPKVADVGTILSGMEMTHREFSQLLTRFGVEFIGTVGDKFDPSLHEAVTQEGSRELPDNTVKSVLQRGCLLHGRLLKPARVVVVVSSQGKDEKDVQA